MYHYIVNWPRPGRYAAVHSWAEAAQRVDWVKRHRGRTDVMVRSERCRCAEGGV